MDLDALEVKTIIRPYSKALYKNVESFNRRVQAETDVRLKITCGLASLVATPPSEAAQIGLFMEKEAIRYAVRKIMREKPGLHEEFGDLSPGLKVEYLRNDFNEGFRNALYERQADSEKEYIRKTALAAAHSAPGALGSPDCAGERGRRRAVLEKEAETAREKFLKFEKYMKSEDLVAADVELAVERRLRELFPELMEQYDFERELQFEAMLKQDPEKLYADKMEEYAFRYLGMLGEDLSAAEVGMETARRALARHEENPPSTLRNIVSMGAERRAWLEKRLELAGEIGRLLGEVSKIETLREEARDGCVPESVRDWVTERIALEHPSLVAACTERERVHWEQANQARLDALESSRDGRGGEERSTERGVAR